MAFKSIDQRMAEYAKAWQGWRIDGKGALVRTKAAPADVLFTKATDAIAQIKSALDPKQKLFVAGIANAYEVDRMNEVIDPIGLMGDNYLKNPILLYQHNHSWPVGNLTMLKPENDGVHFEAWIGDPAAADLTEDQIKVRSLVAQRVLRACSIGFIPHQIRMPTYNDMGEMVDPAKIEKWEMLENSVVAVPCNAGSIFDAKKEPRKEDVQTLVFDKQKFSGDGVKKWAEANGFKIKKVDVIDDCYRLSQNDPALFEADSFRTTEIAPGVKAVVGKRKKSFGTGNVWAFPRLTKGGRLSISTPLKSQLEAKRMELEELMAKQLESLKDISAGINALKEGQATMQKSLETFGGEKGKKPDPKDPPEPDADDENKKKAAAVAAAKALDDRFVALEASLDNVVKSLEVIAKKMAA